MTERNDIYFEWNFFALKTVFGDNGGHLMGGRKMFCPQCGKEYSQRVNFCCHCGTAFSAPVSNSAKRLTRSRTDSKIAGVCGGFASYLDLDVTLVRILWLMLAFFGGWGIIGYFIAWIAMPQEPLAQTAAATAGSATLQPAGNR
jgi:phage shock protein C